VLTRTTAINCCPSGGMPAGSLAVRELSAGSLATGKPRSARSCLKRRPSLVRLAKQPAMRRQPSGSSARRAGRAIAPGHHSGRRSTRQHRSYPDRRSFRPTQRFEASAHADERISDSVDGREQRIIMGTWWSATCDPQSMLCRLPRAWCVLVLAAEGVDSPQSRSPC
jgi:hypothetical protein